MVNSYVYDLPDTLSCSDVPEILRALYQEVFKRGFVLAKDSNSALRNAAFLEGLPEESRRALINSLETDVSKYFFEVSFGEGVKGDNDFEDMELAYTISEFRGGSPESHLPLARILMDFYRESDAYRESNAKAVGQ